MATVSMQRDLVVNLKKETCLNVGILSKLQPMPGDLSRQIFKENALEKPTQNVFNNLSYYLVSIIDSHVCDQFSWPLYDTKTERMYRSQISAFIIDYSAKGLLSPVMSSYLVNPGCYKVVMLMFQMSQLAVQRLLQSKMTKDKQKKLYEDMTEKYKAVTEGFVENIEKETVVMMSKFSNYLQKREAIEKMAGIFRSKILQMEERLESTKAQKFIDDIVDKYVTHNTLDEATKKELLIIKNVDQASPFFDAWLLYLDVQIKEMESKWDEKLSPFLKICSDTQRNTESLIARHTGEAERSSYMVEYNNKTDEICTKELQTQVNSQQKYILKNIVREERLYFPNLIRGFLISICYILKNNEIGDEIYKFNEYLVAGRRNFSELVSAMHILNERVLNAESKLQPSPLLFNQSNISVKEFEIPLLPDLSDLKANRDHMGQVLFDTFTPFSTSKHQFNLRRKHNSFSFQKPQAKSMLNTPFHQAPRDDFLKSVISCRVSSYDRPSVSNNFNNISIISQANNRGNETIAECSSGFTKQQIMRLLSTKKSSSSKKFKYKTERPDINIKKGGLFNESTFSNGSDGLFRSYSSPNLFENREKRPIPKTGRRKLSIMKEYSPSLLEVSGIAAIEKDSSCGTPDGVNSLEGSRKPEDATSFPVIIVTPEPDKIINKILNDLEVDLNKEISIDSNKDPRVDLSKEIRVDLNKEIRVNVNKEIRVDLNKEIRIDLNEDIKINYSDCQPVLKEPKKSLEAKEEKTETPKTNTQLVRKTSSLEKIINRFKKVRANVLPLDSTDENSEFKTIAEEKENMNTVNVDVFTANRILLPDLLSPSCSVLVKSSEYLDQLCMDIDNKESRKPRQSLGTALGVDNTFLDQFDLID